MRGGGIEQKGKRTHGHGQQSCICRGESGVSELNGNGKNTQQKERKKREGLILLNSNYD